MTNPKLPARSEVPVQFTWDTTKVYPDDAAWDAAADRLLAMAPQIAGLADKAGESASALADVLHAVENYGDEVHRSVMYSELHMTVDTNNATAAARLGRARGLAGKAQEAMAFLEPKLMEIGFPTLRKWMLEDPRLAGLGHYFDRLESQAAHVRSAEVEALLGAVEDPFETASATHSILTNSEMEFAPATDLEGNQKVVAQGTIGTLVTDADREIRRTAWENYADAHLKYKNTQANTLITGIKQAVFLARARNYETVLDAKLGANGVPTSVFHNLIDVFKANLPTWHRYWKIRAKALGLSKLREYDVKAPLTQNHPVVPYTQSIEWIAEGMKPLGDYYVDTLRKGALVDRWVDIYPNEGKGAGAYSHGSPGTSPFIFISYTDDIFSMSTLAHEFGHSLHSYLTWENQPLAYSHYSLFVAEVASNFNQAMVRDYLFRTNSDRDFQIAVIEEAMANFHRYFFIMPTLARFELETHTAIEQNKPLTAESMINLMADLFSEAYGEGVEVDRDRTGSTWMQFSTHLYSNYYVFQYATGISGAHALAKPILAGEPGAAERYLDFLRAGSSQYPLDVLKHAGVDLSTPKPVEETFAVLSSLVDRLEALLEE
jgi:oligoendopeptidase F